MAGGAGKGRSTASRWGGTLAADAALLGVAVVWGASYPVAKGALALSSVLMLLFLRFALTAALMTAVAWRDLRGARRADLGSGVVLGLILVSIFLCETCGVVRTTATNAAFVISLCTVLTPCLDGAVSRRLPRSGVLLGAALCCLGAAVLGGGLSGLNGGDGLVFCAAALRACMVIATQRLMSGRALSSAALTAVQAGTVAVVAGAALASTSDHPGLPTGFPFWAAVLFLSLFCTVGALYVQNAAVRRTSPTRVALLFGTEPVFGFVFAVLLLGEPVSPRGLIGGALILAGTAVGLATLARADVKHARRLAIASPPA